MAQQERRAAQLRAILRFPEWLRRHRHWDREVINWMKTSQGNQVLEDMFATSPTIDFLGHVTLETRKGPVTEEEYLIHALRLDVETGRSSPSQDKEERRKDLKQRLSEAKARGYVVEEEGRIRLSDKAETQFYVLTMLGKMYEEEGNKP